MSLPRAATAAALALLAAAPAARADAPRLETLGRDRVVDALKRAWKPTTAVRGGKIITTRKRIRGTASPRLYRAAREGITQYTRRVPGNGTYAVNLYVAEIGGKAPGRRVFDVSAQGQPVATGVDIAGAVGARRADHIIFTTIVTDGVLRLSFQGRVGKPLISGVEVTRMTPSTDPAVVRWGDEFTGKANWWPADALWEYDVGVGSPPGWGSHELQSYSWRLKNVSTTTDGMLALRAMPERYADVDGQWRDYTSARLETGGKFAFTYGLVEARIKMPVGRGIWPAFWAVGDDIDQVGWPRSGEFDIAEILHSDSRTVHASIHGPAAKGKAYKRRVPLRLAGSVGDDFHNYGALRVPGAITMLFDGRPYATFTAADVGRSGTWVFEKPFRLLFNVAVGGDGSDVAPDATTPWPATMLIDWVRVAY